MSEEVVLEAPQEAQSQAARPFDLADLVALEKREEEGVEITVKFADGTPSDFKIRMAGPDSKRVVAARQKMADLRIKAGQMTITAADIEREEVEIVASAIIGWSGLTNGGKEFAFTPENARIVCWRATVREQIRAAVLDRALFTTG